MPHLDLVNDVFENVGLYVSEGVLVFSLAVHANGHAPPLDLLVLGETSVTDHLAALTALFGVDGHREADHTPHQIRYAFVVELLFVSNRHIAALGRLCGT